MGIFQTDFPGTHRHGLSTVSPEPDKIGRHDGNDMYEENPLRGRTPCNHRIDDLGKQESYREYAEQQQTFVDHAGKAARDARVLAGRRYSHGSIERALDLL